MPGQPIKGKYDADIINAMLAASRPDSAITEETVVDSFEITKRPKIKAAEGTVKFSEVFWKPKTIPDLPLPMFEASDWHEEAQLHIPAPDPNWIWNKPVTEQFALAMYCGDTTLLHGLQGTGKSCLVQEWCASFHIPYWRMSCNHETREDHFLGSAALEYNEEGQMLIKQEPTILTDSLRYGGIFCEDEAFRHNSALVLQSLREKNNRTVLLPNAPGRTADERKLRAPENRWWYAMTDNTCGTGDETGVFDAQVQDASTLDRINASIEVSYLPKPDERRLLKKHSTLTLDQINGVLDFAKLVRTAFSQQAMLATFSVRALLAWAEKAQLCRSLEQGLKLSWFDKLSKNDQATARDMYNQVFARKL